MRDLVEEKGQLFTENFFNSVLRLKLTESGREQTMKAPSIEFHCTFQPRNKKRHRTNSVAFKYFMN